MSSVTAAFLPATQPELIHAVIKNMDKHLAIPVLQYAIENPSAPELVPQYKAALKELAKKTYRFDLRRELAAGNAAELEEIKDAEAYPTSMLSGAARGCQCLAQEFFTIDQATGAYAFRHTARDMDERSRQAKFSLPALKSAIGATEHHIRELANLGNLLYEFGRYRDAANVLDLHKRCVTPKYRKRDVTAGDDDQDDGPISFAKPDFGASWGRFACALLLGHRETARDAAQEILNVLDSDSEASRVTAQHVWFLTWHLFLLTFEGRNASTTDLLWLLYRDRKPVNFLKFRYNNTVLCAAAHLTPYIVATAVLNKANSTMLLRAARIVEVESERLRDPLSRFVIALRQTCNFDQASSLITECEAFMKQDFFLHKHVARFAENARMLVAQNKLMVHRNMSTEMVGEMQLVRLIRDSNVDATIDSISKTVTVHTLTQRTVWKQVLDTLSHVSHN